MKTVSGAWWCIEQRHEPLDVGLGNSLESFKIRTLGRMQNIRWTEMVRNDSVGEDREKLKLLKMC